MQLKGFHAEQSKALSCTQWNDFKTECGPSSAPPRYLVRKTGSGGAGGLNLFYSASQNHDANAKRCQRCPGQVSVGTITQSAAWLIKHCSSNVMNPLPLGEGQSSSQGVQSTLMLGERGLAVARGLEREVLHVEIRQDLLVKGRGQLPGVQQSLSYPWNDSCIWHCLF